MSETVRVIAIIGIVVYVVGRQLMGEPLRGKRVVLLPAILAVIGVLDLSKNGRHVEPVDVVFLLVGAAVSLAIGLGQGAMLRLESRDGHLWGQMPIKGLWWWAALIGSRLVLTLIAHGADAKVAASSAPILLLLGVNRLGQAAIVMLHAMATSTPFAPEKDGRSFLASTIQRPYDPKLGPAATHVTPQPAVTPHHTQQSTPPTPPRAPQADYRPAGQDFSPQSVQPRQPARGPAPQPGGVDLRELILSANAWLERRRGGQ